jgi:hypothetical protein
MPLAVLLPAANNSAVVPAPGAASVALSNEAVTPVGNPLTDSATGQLKPLLTLTVVFTVTFCPARTDAADAAVASVNVPFNETS